MFAAVGADWTNREPLLGYPNALLPDTYVVPENGALQLIIDAIDNPDRPHFLILDEMNLSHVERYFADFLSAMESKEPVFLHSGNTEYNGIPPSITLPENLFIIGTVNIDETTYMFSPKVLDRANVIEFKVDKTEMEKFLSGDINVEFGKLSAKGISMAIDFLAKSREKFQTSMTIKNLLMICCYFLMNSKELEPNSVIGRLLTSSFYKSSQEVKYRLGNKPNPGRRNNAKAASETSWFKKKVRIHFEIFG